MSKLEVSFQQVMGARSVNCRTHTDVHTKVRAGSKWKIRSPPGTGASGELARLVKHCRLRGSVQVERLMILARARGPDEEGIADEERLALAIAVGLTGRRDRELS